MVRAKAIFVNRSLCLQLFFIMFMAMVFIGVPRAQADENYQNRGQHNQPEENARYICAATGWDPIRRGAIWFTNSSNYYSASVNVDATADTVSVRIRGSVYGCHNSSTNNTYAVSVRPDGTNSWRLKDLSGTAFWRGQSQGAHNWSTQGNEISAQLDVSGLATNNASGADTQTITIGLYRCFSTNLSAPPAPDACYTEHIPVTVTRAGRPPQTYDGTIRIEKHLVVGDQYPSEGIQPYKANVGVTNNIPGSTWNPQSRSNPFDVSAWVDPDKHNSNTQRGHPTGSYNTYVDVPAGYEVANYTAGGPRPDHLQDPRDMSCTEANNTGRCTVNAIRVTNNATTTIKFNFRLASKGDVNCQSVDTPATATTPATTRFYWRGFGIDATDQGAAPVVKLYEGDREIHTIAGNLNLPVIYDNNIATYPGMLKTTNYVFNVELADFFHDGKTRTITPKLVTAVGADLTLDNVTIPGGDCVGDFAYAWPWLQTSRGDVIASGEINGQVTSPDPAIYPGARLDSSTAMEAEFLIISVVGGGAGPFCSTYKYILTNTTATTPGSCGNGEGYSTLKSYPFLDYFLRKFMLLGSPVL